MTRSLTWYARDVVSSADKSSVLLNNYVDSGENMVHDVIPYGKLDEECQLPSNFQRYYDLDVTTIR